ncbi:Hypothetical protein CINCED_3A009953 [Cinara cedri]|uniref:Uncharacterized protein n=1 Tax=Cinara cedri TaxID=506608 RepID=A0A5E4NH43_9HEMI|nr:Hypothetical protein CINCED_3A009953 [Cinara cedri]
MDMYSPTSMTMFDSMDKFNVRKCHLCEEYLLSKDSVCQHLLNCPRGLISPPILADCPDSDSHELDADLDTEFISLLDFDESAIDELTIDEIVDIFEEEADVPVPPVDETNVNPHPRFLIVINVNSETGVMRIVNPDEPINNESDADESIANESDVDESDFDESTADESTADESTAGESDVDESFVGQFIADESDVDEFFVDQFIRREFIADESDVDVSFVDQFIADESDVDDLMSYSFFDRDFFGLPDANIISPDLDSSTYDYNYLPSFNRRPNV